MAGGPKHPLTSKFTESSGDGSTLDLATNPLFRGLGRGAALPVRPAALAISGAGTAAVPASAGRKVGAIAPLGMARRASVAALAASGATARSKAAFERGSITRANTQVLDLVHLLDRDPLIWGSNVVGELDTLYARTAAYLARNPALDSREAIQGYLDVVLEASSCAMSLIQERRLLGETRYSNKEAMMEALLVRAQGLLNLVDAASKRLVMAVDKTADNPHGVILLPEISARLLHTGGSRNSHDEGRALLTHYDVKIGLEAMAAGPDFIVTGVGGVAVAENKAEDFIAWRSIGVLTEAALKKAQAHYVPVASSASAGAGAEGVALDSDAIEVGEVASAEMASLVSATLESSGTLVRTTGRASTASVAIAAGTGHSRGVLGAG